MGIYRLGHVEVRVPDLELCAAYYTEVGETKRQALNEWIRTGKAYDAVIDFDRVTRDPENPKMFLPLYDSCDHLHPNDAGYAILGDLVAQAATAASYPSPPASCPQMTLVP